MSIVLRHFQESGANSVRHAFRHGKKAPLVVSPTGSGKTVLFSHIAACAAEKGRRIFIVAHRFELLGQISRTLSKFGVRHGLISPRVTPSPLEQVQVAGVQALASRMKKRRYLCDLLIVDEAHHFLGTNTWGKVYEGLGCPLTIGVTATPCRSDGKGLGVEAGGVFDEMIELTTVAQLIDEGYLVKPIVFAPQNELDLAGVKITRGDYEKTELANRVDKPVITGNAVHHYRKHCCGVPAVAFGISLDHCEHIAAEFRASGFNFQVIDGKMDNKLRDHLISNLGKDIHGLVSCDLIGEGVDIPEIGCAILLRPTASKSLHIQQIGRALRPCEGKTNAIILDHVGNTLRHGLPETEHEWSLEGEKKGARKRKADDEPELPIKQCDHCYAVHAPAPECPICGYQYPIKQRKIEQADGELQEITEDMAAEIRRATMRTQGQAQDAEALMALGHSRGRAEKILEARQEKEALRQELRTLVSEWSARTGMATGPVFGFSMGDVRYSMKPKALRQAIADVRNALAENDQPQQMEAVM